MLATTAVAGNTVRWYEWDVSAYVKAEKAPGERAFRSPSRATP